MKILHALGWYFPESLGGTEVYVAALAARQRALRHNVEIAAPLPGLGAAEQREHAGLPVFRYPIPLKPTRAEAQSRVQVRGAEALHHHLDRFRPDILHVHTLTTGLGPRELRAARDLGIHIVATNHLGSVGYLCQRGTLMRWGASALATASSSSSSALPASFSIGDSENLRPGRPLTRAASSESGESGENGATGSVAAQARRWA